VGGGLAAPCIVEIGRKSRSGINVRSLAGHGRGAAQCSIFDFDILESYQRLYNCTKISSFTRHKDMKEDQIWLSLGD